MGANAIRKLMKKTDLLASEIDLIIRQGSESFDFHRLFIALPSFCATDLSSFYFDIRKDSLYCDSIKSRRRRAARTVLSEIYSCLTAWFAPILCFTSEEAWLLRNPGDQSSVHLRQFPEIPNEWHKRKSKDNPRYKTQLCSHWINTGECRYGSRCVFAHGETELRIPIRNKINKK